MPFDKISPHQLFIMRILTGTTFVALGGVLAVLSGMGLFDLAQGASHSDAPLNWIFYFATLNFGVFLANAGLMLLELITRPPMKLAINVPFVAANFQTALCLGLVATVFAVQRAFLPGTTSSMVPGVEALSIIGCFMNLFFVVMTKLHWNYTENTGKPLPK